MKILITGAAGFIGHHLSLNLLRAGYEVTGIDSVNDYYDVRLKHARLADLGIVGEVSAEGVAHRSAKYPSFEFLKMRLEDAEGMDRLFAERRFDVAVNLAAQAGVRYSLENPRAYVDSNVSGFLNVLECCRRHPVRHLLYASSSSVYGGNTKVPFCEDDAVDNPVSLYAATKRSDELMAGVYARLFGVPSSGLRFFTVYGPWGRPDMAPMLFARAIMAGEPLKVFNGGDMERDFTYVDDIVESVARLVDKAPEGDVPTTIYNVGCGRPMRLLNFIATLENALGRKASLRMMPMQSGDVVRTWADTGRLRSRTGYAPSTRLEDGIARFAEWYMSAENPLREN